MVDVEIRYWAGAAAAAGVESETIAARSIAEALATAGDRHEGLASVIAVCTILCDGQRVSGEAAARDLEGPVSIEVLPPFAGG